MKGKYEQNICPFMRQQSEKKCPMLYNMPCENCSYGNEEINNEDNSYTSTYNEYCMNDEEYCPLSRNRYPMMMPMPMIMQFEDDEE